MPFFVLLADVKKTEFKSLEVPLDNADHCEFAVKLQIMSKINNRYFFIFYGIKIQY